MWLRVELAKTWEVAKACCKKIGAIRDFDGSYSAYRQLPLEGLPMFSVQTLHNLPLYIDWGLDIGLSKRYIYIYSAKKYTG